MFKNLVKRSKVQRITVTTSSPVSLLVEGDEVYVWARQNGNYEPGSELRISRQLDREAHKYAQSNITDDITQGYVTIDIGGYKAPLGGVMQTGQIQAISPFQGDSGVNLLCGFSDQVIFSLPVVMGEMGPNPYVVDVFIEIINYEPRR